MDTPTTLQEAAVQTFDLNAIAAELEREEAFWSSRRAASSLVKEDDLTVVLTTVLKGETIREHAAPKAAFVTVLEGEIILRFADEEKRLAKGQSVAFAGGVRHAVEAPEDARFIVVLGGSSDTSHLSA
jgi:quercetin dioxygenase-like cupin family protein